MAFVSLDSADLEAGKPVDESLMDQIKDNFDALNADIGTLSTGNIPNGDMEIDTDSDDTPDSWSVTLYPGGAQTLETTNPLNGTQSLKFTHPGGAGNGGGYAESDYLTCGYLANMKLSWLMQSSAAGIYNIVLVRWFDEDKVYLSSSTCFSSTTNPTSVQCFSSTIEPPSGAKFCRVRVVGGHSSVNVAGTVIFDDVNIRPISEWTQRVTSAVSSVDFINLEGKHRCLELSFSELQLSSTTSVYLYFSSDNGATFPTGISVVTLNLATTDELFGRVKLGFPNEPSERPFTEGAVFATTRTTGSTTGGTYGVSRAFTSTIGGHNINAVRVVGGSGTITNGTFTLRAI